MIILSKYLLGEIYTILLIFQLKLNFVNIESLRIMFICM